MSKNDPLDNFYTPSEKTVAKYTVYQAVQSAAARLRGKPVCTDALKGRPNSDKITLQQLNDLADQMVSDSKYWAS